MEPSRCTVRRTGPSRSPQNPGLAHATGDGGQEVPDPASRYHPDDVHGASRVVDPAAFVWRDEHWKGRPWEEVVLYELHVGSFTPEGTFAGIKEKLDYLVDLSVSNRVDADLGVPRTAQLGLRWRV